MEFTREDILKQFGKRVKIERIKKDLTQENLAEILDVSQNYIAKIEIGRQNMSLLKINELAAALGVNVDKLITGDLN